MKKSAAKIAYTLAFTALLSAGAAVCVLQNPQIETRVHAAETECKDLLISPASYAQYLPLESPTDVAVTDDYIAVADGNAVYVYDSKDEVYRKYVHTQNVDAPKNVITKLQFDGAGNLYFLDSSTYLYILRVKDLETEQTPTPTKTNFSCSTFAIHGSWLYFSSVTGKSQLSKTPLSNPDVSTATTLVESLYSDPKIAFWKDELYYTNADVYLNKIDPEENNPTPVLVHAFQSGIRSMRISEGIFVYSDTEDNFYAYALADILSHGETPTPLTKDQGGYKSLCAHGEYVYAVQNHAVRRYSLTEKAFTDYEICNRSAAINRLDGATQTYLHGDKLFIADNGNARISIYDRATDSFQAPIALSFSPQYLTSDGNTVLAANQEQAALYGLSPENYGEELSVYQDFNGEVIGGASVYGAYYFATENNFYYCLTQTETQNQTQTEWTWTETKKSSTRYIDLLSSDAYGYLYAASGNKLLRFTEEEFLSPTAEGNELSDEFPVGATQFLVDYEGKVYALKDNALQTLDGERYDLSDAPVYGGGANALSVSFGVEENAAYILYAENYILQTERLHLPTVKKIDAENAGKDIFAQESANVSIVRTLPDTLLIEFDLESLTNAEYFPYLSHGRKTERFTALKIAQTQKHAILAVYDQTSRKYFTYLALHENCEVLEENEFRIPYTDGKTGYLTNAVTLYKYPYLNDLLPVTELSRGAQITVLGEINRLDHPYYQISYTSEQGERHVGYVPKSYVTLFDGAPPQSQTQTYGVTESNVDGIWRLAYLALGALAICILVDILLLREEKKEDEDE